MPGDDRFVSRLQLGEPRSAVSNLAQVQPYFDGSKGLLFQQNSYFVPNMVNRYWVWGDATKSWSDWQALGQDTTGTAVLR